MLSRNTILGFKDDRIGTFEVPELSGEIFIASFTVAEMDMIANHDRKTPLSVEAVIVGTCDKTGKRLFTADDRDALAKMPARIIGAMATAILAHNGLGVGLDPDDAKNGSSGTGNSGSASDLPPTSDEQSPS